MPQRIEEGSCTTANAALRATFNGCLEVFIKRNTAGVERFTVSNWAAQRTNTTRIDTDTGTLRNIFNNGAGGRVNRVQAVARFN